MITAFLLGLTGSLHCAGMCGPLVLLTPVVRNSRITSRFLYHAGRIGIYALIGVVFGLFGESLVLVGLERWLSLIAGLLLLLALFCAGPLQKSLGTIPVLTKRIFGSFLHRQTFPSIVVLGAINGLLPCGLVYLAGAASIAAGGPAASALHMIFFGLGTLPVLLGISTLAGRMALPRIAPLRNLGPVLAGAVAILLIVRSQPSTLFSGIHPPPDCPACHDVSKTP